MARALTWLLLAAFVLSGCSKPAVSKPAGLDVSGVWVGEAVSEYATVPLRLELTQTGQTLTGTATSTAPVGTATSDDLSGKVDAQQVTFSFSYNLGSINGSAEIIARYAFVGTVTGSTMTGNVTFSAEGFGPPQPGTFAFQKHP